MSFLSKDVSPIKYSSTDAALAGIHIGGGVSPITADGKFFGELPIE